MARSFHEQGIRSPTGRAHWNASPLRWLLRNPVCTGQVYAGRTRERPAQRRRSALEPPPEVWNDPGVGTQTQWTLVATIPPLVSQEQFDQVQVKLKESRQRARRKNKTQE